MSELDDFVASLHPTSSLLSWGKASIMDKEVEAVKVSNLYGQHVVWGLFSVNNRKGKFEGKLANNANTEGVVYKALRAPAVVLTSSTITDLDYFHFHK